MVEFDRPRPSELTALLVLAFLLLSPPPAVAATTTSGSATFHSTDGYGSSTYTLLYSYPSQATTGSALVMQLTLYVTSYTGFHSYLLSYRLFVTLSIDASHVVTGVVNETTGLKPIYPGGHWGPVNLSLPLTELNTGVGGGEAKDASIMVELQDEVWIASPVSYNFPETSQAAAGQVTVTSSGQGSQGIRPYLSYLLVAGGVAVAAVAFFFLREPRKKGAPDPQLAKDEADNRHSAIPIRLIDPYAIA